MEKLNECSLIRHFGERCIVCSMSEQSSVGVLLLRRSEGSHELKMWFHCGMAEKVLCHGELQLQFHIVFILTWQQLSTCYTRFTSAKFFCSFIYAPPLHPPASTFISSPFFCHYFSVSSRQLCFNFLWLKKPFSTSTYSTRLEGTWLSSVLVAILTYKYHLMCLGSLHQYCWKSCDAICMRHTQPNNGGRRRDGIAAARCTAFRQTWGSWCCCCFFGGFLCSHFQKWRVSWRSRSHDSWSEASDWPMCGSLSVDTIKLKTLKIEPSQAE